MVNGRGLTENGKAEKYLIHLPSNLKHYTFLPARSSSGLGRRPLKAEIAGSPKGTPSEESRTYVSMLIVYNVLLLYLKKFKG